MAKETVRTATGTAPGKVILFGEHAVVYGAPALGLPLSKEVSVRLTQGCGRMGVRLAHGLEATPSAEAASPEALAQRALGPLFDQVDVEIALSFPPMSGFGSSAALALALLRAKDAWSGKKPAKGRALVERVMGVERLAHAKPSGVDPAICTASHLVRFQRGDDGISLRRAKVGASAFLVVGAVGQHGGARQSVSRMAALRSGERRLVEAAMATLGETTQTGARALAKGDLIRAGQAMDVAHGVLSGFDLVSTGVDTAVRLARTSGALGAKMSGAGGAGGAFVALFAHREVAARARRRLAASGAIAWVEDLMR